MTVGADQDRIVEAAWNNMRHLTDPTDKLVLVALATLQEWHGDACVHGVPELTGLAPGVVESSMRRLRDEHGLIDWGRRQPTLKVLDGGADT